MNEVMQTMMAHRSVRRYQEKALPEGLLEELVACGQHASTSSNMQAYTVIHVADPELKTELAGLCGDQAQIHQSAAFLVFCADLNRLRLAGDMQKAERFDGDWGEALLIATVDAALVMQNVAVAAESVGLGICMIGAIRNHPAKAGELLGLPPNAYAVSGLCLGYPDESPSVKPRLPQEAVLHTDRYLDETAHRELLTHYDEAMAAFYASQDMHPDDPRWTTVASGRAGQFHRREGVDAFLKQQGFRLR